MPFQVISYVFKFTPIGTRIELTVEYSTFGFNHDTVIHLAIKLQGKSSLNAYLHLIKHHKDGPTYDVSSEAILRGKF